MWVSEVAVPSRVSTVPSPQSTLTKLTVPSGSAAVKFTLMVVSVRAGLGDTEVMRTVGGKSMTVRENWPELVV